MAAADCVAETNTNKIGDCLRVCRPTEEEDERKGRVRNDGEVLPPFQVQVLKRTGD
jgi:hypothetical protein